MQVEISLPDEAGRTQILTIHTAPMRDAKYLDPAVSLPQVTCMARSSMHPMHVCMYTYACASG